MTSKQRAYLRSLANPLEAIVHVGKGGVSDTLFKQALETAPETAREAAETIAAAVGAEVVQVIGRVFVLYRRNNEEPKIVLPKGRN